MKCKVVIDKEKEEVVIYTKEYTELIKDIEQYILNKDEELLGFIDKRCTKLNLSDIYCFTVEDNKVLALTKNEKYVLRERLYILEEKYSNLFIKINQSCLVNKDKIKRFDASFSGTLLVILKNDYKDYVSRRQVKTVKERLGL